MPAATAPLASLSQKLVKSRHCLHAQELQCESHRTECEKSKQTVEQNDASISAMEEQERKLKMQCARMRACVRFFVTGASRCLSRRRLLFSPVCYALVAAICSLSSPDVEAKLAYEKMHALKYGKQQDLKLARQQKMAISKESDSLAGQLAAKRNDWNKAHDDHMKSDKQARALSDKMEAVEKDKEAQKRRCQKARDDVSKYEKMHEMLKRELDVIAASAASV